MKYEPKPGVNTEHAKGSAEHQPTLPTRMRSPMIKKQHQTK